MTVKKDDKTEEKPQEDLVQIPKAEFEGLKSQIEEMNKFRSETEDYLKGASVVVNTLASDPSLTAAFRAKLGVVEPGQVPGQQQEQIQKKETPSGDDGGKAQQYSQDINELKGSQKEEIVAAFEREYGIASLPDDQKRETRGKLESYLNDFGWSISGKGGQTPPLTSLRGHLEKAYVGTHAEKLREEGKLEGFVQARTNESGVMGSFPAGSAEQSGQETKLTAKQEEWAKKLGVDPEGAKKTFLEKDQEETRKSQGEVRAEESKKFQ